VFVRFGKEEKSAVTTRDQLEWKDARSAESWEMDLFLRKIRHPQAHDNYRVILKDDGVEIEEQGPPA
jgi:hypothetical protein